jgi:hypothetical protein
MVLVSALGAAHGLPNMAHDSEAKAYVLKSGRDAIPLDAVKT